MRRSDNMDLPYLLKLFSNLFALKQVNGQEVKDFNASSSYDLTTKGRYVMAPFWFVYYMYKGEKYYFLMDGLGEHHALSNPVNEVEVAAVEKNNKVKKNVTYCWILTLIPLFAGAVPITIALLVIWLIAKLITDSKMKNKTHA